MVAILLAVVIWGLFQLNSFLLLNTATADSPAAPPQRVCDERCQDAGIRRRLIKKYTPEGRYAIPSYIVSCESGGNPRAVNSSSGAGGAYQIMPSTWSTYKARVGHKTRRALADIKSRLKALPQQTDMVAQNIVARIIWKDAGAGAWSCS